VRRLLSLQTSLREATKIPANSQPGGGVLSPVGEPFLPSTEVIFPKDQVFTVDRAGMWIDSDCIRIGMWPAELKPQYTRVYAAPRKVEALLELENDANWTLKSNFHLAYRWANPRQRWYPGRHLPAQLYLNQWIKDFRKDAGGRTLDEVANPRFFRWLVERGYAHESEHGSLEDWVHSKPSGTQVHIRPSIRIVRTWPYAEACEQDRQEQFVTDVRETINKVLRALGEPELKALRVGETSQRRTLGKPKSLARVVDSTQKPACPTCHMVHAGECF
jgi:O-acetyl-ADP-ribose deacetylase